MTYGNRHFGIYEGNKEEVIILGYRKKTNDVLIAFPSALQQQDAQDLRRIVSGEAAQKKDYLMDTVGGSVLASAHHSSAGIDWQTYLLKQAESGRGNGVVRKTTMKEIEFFDQSQKAFFAGYGNSIEPEIEALRQNRLQAQEASLTGRQVLPEPTVEEINAAKARQEAAANLAATALAAPAAPVVDPNAALVAALSAIAAGQQAILEKLSEGDAKPTPRKKPARKPVKKRAAKTKTTKDDTTPETSETDVPLSEVRSSMPPEEASGV